MAPLCVGIEEGDRRSSPRETGRKKDSFDQCLFLFSYAAEGAAAAASVTNTFISSLRSFAASDSPFFHSLFRSLTDFDFGGHRFDAATSKDFPFSPILH